MLLDRYITIRIWNENVEISTINGDIGISAGTSNLQEILCDRELSFGQLCANKFEVELFTKVGNWIDITGMNIEVRVRENELESYLFTGIIDSAITDEMNRHRQVVAYDKSYYLRDINVAEWWNNFWASINVGEGEVPKARLVDIRNSLCDYVGLEYIATPQTNDGLYVYNYNSFTSITFGDMMKMICEVQTCMPNINRAGVLEFIELTNIPRTTLVGYEKGNSSFEDFTTSIITGVNIYDSSDNVSVSFGEVENAYPISGNIFILSLPDNDEINSVCSAILNSINMIAYVPCNVKLITSDLDYKLGDLITTTRGNHYIMSNTLSGSLLIDQEIQSVAYSERLNQQPSAKNDTIIEGKRFSSFVQEIDKITSTVGIINGNIVDIESDLHDTKVDVQNAVSRIEQLPNELKETFITVDNESFNKLVTVITTSVDGVNIKSSDVDSNLQLAASGTFIRNGMDVIASMEANQFTMGEWVLQRSGNTLNIYRRHD